MSTDKQVIIVGAGLAGLSCAVNLKRSNIPFIILEAAESVGGRIRTDKIEGFLLDRGFQVLLSDYPEAKNLLDLDSLDLQEFKSGALIRHKGRFHRFFDPCRQPNEIFNTLFSSIGSFADMAKMAKLKFSLSFKETNEILSTAESSTISALDEYGFSSEIIENFFRPFFGGVFLDKDLTNSSRLFNWLFKIFSSGSVAIPRLGMEEIPKQLANNIGTENVRLNCKVDLISGNTVILSSGEKISAPYIVLATPELITKKLISNELVNIVDRSVTCFYYSADNAPTREAALILNGDSRGPINNLCVMNNISTDYAPPGKSLISVSVIDKAWQSNENLDNAVRAQCIEWFNEESNNWRHLKTYKIKYALPPQVPPTNFLSSRHTTSTGQYICGDYTDTASINGALQSGRRVAELIRESALKRATN